MTRFARAKGSKASNERTPNDATPWHVMKEQLTENLAKKQGAPEKVKSAKELLKEKEEPFYYDTTGNVNHDWAEFEESKPKKAKNQSDSVSKEKVKEKKKRSATSQEVEVKQKTSSNGAKASDSNKEPAESGEIEKKKGSKRKVDQSDDNVAAPKKSKKHKKEQVSSADVAVSETKTSNSDEGTRKKLKKKKKKEVSSSEADQGESKKDISGDLNNSQNDTNEQTQNFQKLSKRQKRNMRKKNKSGEESNATSDTFNVSGNDWDTSIKHKTNKKLEKIENANGKSQTEDNADGAVVKDNQNKHGAQQFKKGPMEGPKNFNNISNKFGKRPFDNGNQNNKRKAPKIRDDKEHKRRKPEAGPTKVTINGVEVEIVKYDGFPVKKEDAERLRDLKQQMIMKGIPKAEIDAAMKLERRKAEKALARIKKCVCFHCRKSGHNLSDCPELGSEQAGTGICFKCGSTEHTHFECKVAKATEYRYASCFICREQGHIAKQCPDNPKGVYPQGGACKICGDVTHLKKDCPDLAKEKEETAITVDTIANDTLESLEESSKRVSQKDNTNPKKKVVKF